jgi:hypothetical protein
LKSAEQLAAHLIQSANRRNSNSVNTRARSAEAECLLVRNLRDWESRIGAIDSTRFFVSQNSTGAFDHGTLIDSSHTQTRDPVLDIVLAHTDNVRQYKLPFHWDSSSTVALDTNCEHRFYRIRMTGTRLQILRWRPTNRIENPHHRAFGFVGSWRFRKGSTRLNRCYRNGNRLVQNKTMNIRTRIAARSRQQFGVLQRSR